MTGGLVYYGSRFPELQGAYIYGDYSHRQDLGRPGGGGGKWSGTGSWPTPPWPSWPSRVDADGNLLVLDYRDKGKGGFYSLEVNAAPDSSDRFPRRLSGTGLFASVPGHRLTPGMIPYSVNAPLWSDGAFKERSPLSAGGRREGRRTGAGPAPLQA